MLFVFVPSVSVLTMKFSFPHLHFNLCSVEPVLYLILGPMIAVLPPRNVVFLHFLERPLHLHFRLVDIGIGWSDQRRDSITRNQIVFKAHEET